jgi:hypothetical protein
MEVGRLNAKEEWLEVAVAAVIFTAKRNEFFTADDVEAEMEALNAPPITDKRALGAVMLRAAKGKWIRATDQFRPSVRRVCHQNPKRIWKSNVHIGL